jgi:hypothetical protein
MIASVGPQMVDWNSDMIGSENGGEAAIEPAGSQSAPSERRRALAIERYIRGDGLKPGEGWKRRLLHRKMTREGRDRPPP